ncbi:hypothetical protein AGDE_01681 [Angomonas deanei]|uniref:Uncharacterized protein n=1 Tax=Angomonas deanei TaxID=59799 RepID=A0A7G2CH93_9TRYP|nr:hypothetical protein AGDE_01681 [Angomonas deanei]CAD2218341.1 hypothetical protein, conserved [Angomonas deanei]|eukprot:EPY42242.1 hypothetical protein AGDE_01681 [Angomonas deanei]
MRKSVFYMGRAFTQRHLNAVRSPLLTGFVRPSAALTNQQGMASMITPSALVASPLSLSASTDTPLSQVVNTLIAAGLSQTAILSILSMQNISTCVFACEKVFCGMKSLNLFSF